MLEEKSKAVSYLIKGSEKQLFGFFADCETKNEAIDDKSEAYG